MEKIVGVYLIENRLNGKIYVVSSLNVKRRLMTHVNKLTKNKHHSDKLQMDWDIYGLDSFKFEVLEEVDNTDELDKREQYWITYYRSSSDDGYNVKSKATRKKTIPDESRQKSSESAKARIFTEEMLEISKNNLKRAMPTPEGIKKTSDKLRGRKRPEEVKEKIRSKLQGREVSEETRKKLSESSKGKKHTEEAKKNMSEAHKNRPHLGYGSKLREEDVVIIKTLLRDNLPVKIIADKFHLDVSYVYQIRKGRTWKHIVVDSEEVN